MAIYLLGYGLACWLYPFAHCHWCRKTGIRTTPILRRIKACRMCGGSQRRLRLGRRAYNLLNHIRTDAANARNTRERLTGERR